LIPERIGEAFKKMVRSGHIGNGLFRAHR
jgi:hypothetical protein